MKPPIQQGTTRWVRGLEAHGPLHLASEYDSGGPGGRYLADHARCGVPIHRTPVEDQDPPGSQVCVPCLRAVEIQPRQHMRRSRW